MKDWIRFLFNAGEFSTSSEGKIQLFIISPQLDFCAMILCSGILHSIFSNFDHKRVVDYENHIGESFIFPATKQDGLKLFTGTLDKVVNNELYFVIRDSLVEYKTSLGRGKNWRKKTSQTSHLKETCVIREKYFRYVHKIQKETDLSGFQSGVNFDSVSYYFFGSGSTILNSQDSKSCLIVDQKKRLIEELESEFDLERTDPNLKKTVRFADIIHPYGIKHSSKASHTLVTRSISDQNFDYQSVILIGSNNYLNYGGNLENDIIITVVSPDDRSFFEAIEKANTSFESRHEEVQLPSQLIKNLPLSFDIQAWC